jgi:hypothetical protein
MTFIFDQVWLTAYGDKYELALTMIARGTGDAIVWSGKQTPYTLILSNAPVGREHLAASYIDTTSSHVRSTMRGQPAPL